MYLFFLYIKSKIDYTLSFWVCSRGPWKAFENVSNSDIFFLLAQKKKMENFEQIKGWAFTPDLQLGFESYISYARNSLFFFDLAHHRTHPPADLPTSGPPTSCRDCEYGSKLINGWELILLKGVLIPMTGGTLVFFFYY